LTLVGVRILKSFFLKEKVMKRAALPLAVTVLLSLSALTLAHTGNAVASLAQTAESALTAETALTQYLIVGNTRFAYRELGPASGTPLVFLQRFRGTMDDWDPALVNAIAEERYVILFDNAGVGLSGGQVPTTFEGIAADAARFIEVLGHEQVDVLGFSIGGVVAQVLSLTHPDLVRRAVLAASTAGGPGIRQGSQDVSKIITQPGDVSTDLNAYRTSFFTSTAAGRAAAATSYQRINTRLDRVPATRQRSWGNQFAAAQAWFDGTDSYSGCIGSITQPVLIANCDRDLILPTYNSFLLFDQIPNAQLVIYPDAGHGFLFQYASEFAEQVTEFLK
jgi:pimeloyl-ACP methyl ester carboxylesterase